MEQSNKLYFDRYISKSLSEDERLAFEQQIKEDVNFAVAFWEYVQLRKALIDIRLKEFEEVEGFEDDEFLEDEPTPVEVPVLAPPAPTRKWLWLLLLLAAVLAVCAWLYTRTYTSEAVGEAPRAYIELPMANNDDLNMSISTNEDTLAQDQAANTTNSPAVPDARKQVTDKPTDKDGRIEKGKYKSEKKTIPKSSSITKPSINKWSNWIYKLDGTRIKKELGLGIHTQASGKVNVDFGTRKKQELGFMENKEASEAFMMFGEGKGKELDLGKNVTDYGVFDVSSDFGRKILTFKVNALKEHNRQDSISGGVIFWLSIIKDKILTAEIIKSMWSDSVSINNKSYPSPYDYDRWVAGLKKSIPDITTEKIELISERYKVSRFTANIIFLLDEMKSFKSEKKIESITELSSDALKKELNSSNLLLSEAQNKLLTMNCPEPKLSFNSIADSCRVQRELVDKYDKRVLFLTEFCD